MSPLIGRCCATLFLCALLAACRVVEPKGSDRSANVGRSQSQEGGELEWVQVLREQLHGDPLHRAEHVEVGPLGLAVLNSLKHRPDQNQEDHREHRRQPTLKTQAATTQLARRPQQRDDKEEHDHEDFDSFIVALKEIADPAALAARVAALAEKFDVLRAKGDLGKLDPTERWMLVANQDSNLVSVFARNTKTGTLANEGKSFGAPAPMCC